MAAETLSPEPQHALLSPSSAHRWIRCPAAPAREARLPDETSEAAAQGTAAHALAEWCITVNEYAAAYPDATMLVDGYVIEIDSEMRESVSAYVDCIDPGDGAVIEVETRVDIGEWVPGSWGTVDALAIDIEHKTLVITDLKYGQEWVSAKDNPQLLLYGLGAYSDYDWLHDIETVELHIAQPRLDNWDSVTLTADELLAEGEILKTAAELTEQPDAPATPGQIQCKYCKAKAHCPELAEFVLQQTLEDFAGDLSDLPPASLASLSDVGAIDLNTLAELLDYSKLIDNWTEALRARATNELNSHHAVGDWKLVAGRGRRVWNNADKLPATLRRKWSVKKDELFETKMRGPAAVEKLIPKEDYPQLRKLWSRIPGNPTLAPGSDKRESIVSNPADDFEEELTNE